MRCSVRTAAGLQAPEGTAGFLDSRQFGILARRSCFVTYFA